MEAPHRKSDAAHLELRRRIMVAQLRPGVLLDEKALSEELEIGRTPMREAVLRLEQEGLVVSKGRRGYIIAETSPMDLMHVFELRRELECFSAGLAALRRTDADIANFDEFLARIESELETDDGDIAWNLGADEDFHRLVVTASGNRFSAQYLSFLFGMSVRSLYLSSVPVTLVRDEIDSYRGVIEAIREGNADRAREVMNEHLTIGPTMALLSRNRPSLEVEAI